MTGATRPRPVESLTDRINAAHDELDVLLGKPAGDIDDWAAYWRSLADVEGRLAALYNRKGDAPAAARFRAAADRNAGYAQSSAIAQGSEA